MQFIKTLTTTFREVGLLALVAIALLGANYSFGAWSNPGSNPPNGNVAAPINVGSADQAKAGILGANRLNIISGFPILEFAETDEHGSRIVNNNSILHFQANRGTIAAPSWETSLSLRSSDATGGKYALFSSEVRATSFLYSSDERLKSNIETVDGLDIVEQLRGVSYTWNSTGNKDYGLIAQEVEAVLPELVRTDEAGMKSVDYAHMVGFLVEAIKQQQQQINALESQLHD